MAVFGARECFGSFADERTRDDATDFVFAVEHFAGDLADFVLAFDWNNFFVRGDLKDRIGGRIDNRFAGFDMFFAELFDDLRAARRNVGKHAGNIGFCRKFVNDRLWKTVWKSRKSLFQNDSRHFPMPGRRVFAVRFQSAFAVASDRIFDGRKIFERANIAESELLQIRQIDFARFQNISQSIRTRIAPFGRIGHRADSRAVQNHQNDSSEFRVHKRILPRITRITRIKKMVFICVIRVIRG